MTRAAAAMLAMFLGVSAASAEALNMPEPASTVAILRTPPAQEPDALTLTECYQLALKRSEQLAIDSELIKETEARFAQALSTALPHVSFVSSDIWQDGSGASVFTLRHVPERSLTLSQTLFAGFKEFAAMAGTRQERRERQENRARAEQLLLVDVANAFHLLMEQREDLATLEAIRIALVDRLDELQERERLGRSRPSESKSVEARLRRAEADLAQVRERETLTRHLMEFLTGAAPLPPVRDDDAPLSDPEAERVYLAAADTRADVLAAEAAWKAAEKEVAIARAKFWPTVTADGNYYLDRVGVAQDVKWDVTLTVDVPLFQGGEAAGGVREATSKARQARWHYVERQRAAELDIRDAYAKFASSLVVSDLFRRALNAAEDSYSLQAQDYRLSLVNNLDVLQALETLQAARRDRIHASREAKRLYWQLRAATGETL